MVKGIGISDDEEKIEEKIILLSYLQKTAICHEPLEIFFPFFICKQGCVLHKILHTNSYRFQRWSLICSHLFKEKT